MSRARLLHVITGLGAGGAERILHTLLEGGLADAAENHVVSLSDEGVYGLPIASLGVSVRTLGLRAGRPTLTAVRDLRRIARAIRPDIVQGWMYHGNIAATMATAFAPTAPALAWNIRHALYADQPDTRGTRLVIGAGRAVSHRPARIVYNSHQAREQHEAAGYAARRSQVIPNGFDTASWRPDAHARRILHARLGLGEGHRLIGYVGRHHPLKDIPTLLRALAPLMEADRGLHCVLVGRGITSDAADLAPLIAALPAGRTHLLGQQDDVAATMAGFDVLCLSSVSEASPNVIGEAMALAVPCVATDVGECRAMIGETGRVVAPADPAALSAALADLLGLPEVERRALGAAARARIAERFGLGGMVESYLALYADLRKGRRACAE